MSWTSPLFGATVPAAIATLRRRGPSLAKRTYQGGSVFQKGKSQSDRWDANATAYGRFWKDVPGGLPKRVVLSLGVVRTRTLAKRKLFEHIEELGVNRKQFFIESTSRLTFAAQGEFVCWDAEIYGRAGEFTG